MAENSQNKITAFDTLFTNNRIQMLKIMLTYMEPSQQKTIAVYIKLMELQHTITFLETHPYLSLDFPCENEFNTAKLCDEIACFCSPAQRTQINQMKNMYQSFENIQEIMQMMQMMKEMFPEGDSSGMDPAALFSNFSGMDDMSSLSQIFEMFQNQ